MPARGPEQPLRMAGQERLRLQLKARNLSWNPAASWANGKNLSNFSNLLEPEGSVSESSHCLPHSSPLTGQPEPECREMSQAARPGPGQLSVSGSAWLGVPGTVTCQLAKSIQVQRTGRAGARAGWFGRPGRGGRRVPVRGR